MKILKNNIVKYILIILMILVYSLLFLYDIIKTNKNEGDILKQGDTVEVTLSRGSLKMPKFDNFDDFSKWADKYEIK